MKSLAYIIICLLAITIIPFKESAIWAENHTVGSLAGSKDQLSATSIRRVWANDGGDKVSRDELRAANNPDSVLNSIWNGSKIALFGARNEVVAFNLVLEAPSVQANNVSISISALNGPRGDVITSLPASGEGIFNWVGRNIELFYIRYLQITGLSTDLFYDHYDERHIPERFRRPWTGEGEGRGTWEDRPDHDKFYPEIAIPLELIGGFNIAAGTNQSIWVDIYIPKNATAGLYKGTLSVKENAVTILQVPVDLTVLNFNLPSLPSARTMLCYSAENVNDRYLNQPYINPGDPLYQKSLTVANRHFQMAHRHKISLIGNDGGYTPVEQMKEAWKDRLTGTLFTAANGYDGPGVGKGNNVYVIGEYGQWPWKGGTQEEMWTRTNEWVQWFEAQAFLTPTEFFLYLIDESENYEQIERWSQWMDNNPGPGKRLMSMATIDLPDAAQHTPSLDIPTSWAGIGISQIWQNAVDKYLQNPQKRFYVYNGNRPACGSFAIEDDGIALRALAWAHYKKKIDRWFYWESTYYDNYQGGEGQTNVFQRAQTYGSYDKNDPVLGKTGWNYLNGDGVLFYPGTDSRFPAESYGAMGPFASLRMKLWRRGLQDVDYLNMAAAVNPARTAKIVDQIVPKVLWEYGVSDPGDPTWVLTDISWSNDPDIWEKARAELGAIITSRSKAIPGILLLLD